MSNVNVSVIVPVFNKEEYLEECLHSLINQTLENIEVICVDDGSTDNSPKILEEYKKKDSRIKVFKQENKGPGNARNNALKHASGDYVAFVDADDWIELDALRILYENALENDSELVLFNAIEYLPNKQFRKRIYYPEDIDGSFNFLDKKDIVMNNFLIACTKLHKLSFINENQLTFSENALFEDVYFHIKSMIKANNASYVKNIFYNYRRTETNTRQSNSLKSSESFLFLNIISEVRKLLIDENVYDLMEKNFCEFKLTQLKNLFENNDDKERFFELLNDDFNKNIIKPAILEQIPPDKRDFYLKIKNSENYKKFIQLSEKNKKENSGFLGKIFKRILK